MTNWVHEGSSYARDKRERVGNGTIGGPHVVSRGLGGRKVNAVIDDTNANIVYGIAAGYGITSGTFSQYATDDFLFGGTQTIIGGSGGSGVAGSAASYRFKGTAVAVIGSINPQSGNMRVFIDGVETKGRIPVYTAFRISGGSPHANGNINPIVDASATTFPALAGATSFSAAGTFYINGELVDYTSRDSNGFYGCTRGAHGTVAAAHTANETLYQWDSAVGLYSTNYSTKQILYYNPLLSPGEHTIVIIAETNSTSTYARVYLDGFSTGSLLGAGNIFTQISQITMTVPFDSNGHCDIGQIVSQNNDVARLAFLGMTQTNCETTNTTIMGKLGVTYATDGTPFYYFHNGPISSTVTINVTFAFLGETI